MFRDKILLRFPGHDHFKLIPVYWYDEQPYAKTEDYYYGLLSSGVTEISSYEWRLTKKSGKLADWLDRMQS